MNSSHTEIIVDRPHEGAATLTLNRPERKNALSVALRDEVSDALATLAAEPDVKVVVITGAGTSSRPASICASSARRGRIRSSRSGCGTRPTASTACCSASRCR